MKKNLVGFLKKHKLIPFYTEVSLFLILVSFLLIYFIENEFRLFIDKYLLGNNIFVLIILLLGIIGIIKFAFDTKSAPTPEAKSIMIIFAIVAEIIASVLLFLYNLEFPSIINIVLAIFNLLQAIYLYVLFRQGLISEENISSDNAKYYELIIGALFIIIIFAITKYIYHFAWQIIFSLLISYSISFNDFIASSFIKRLIEKV